MSADTSLPLSGTVLVTEATQYGAPVMKPANKLAQALCGIAGTKTVTHYLIRQFKDMGLTVMTTGAEPRQL